MQETFGGFERFGRLTPLPFSVNYLTVKHSLLFRPDIDFLG